ncbi:MAG: YeaH/YhbH family protein [Neptunomonas phycophila]|uniref:YeaH/YhbH family protein n=1 Tax=Neptunomonas phycophila TaxID=1572645 RepID=UPI003B8D8E60
MEERSKYYIIDRRKNGRGKSSPNRERFLKRQADAIKNAVRNAISARDITDMDSKGVEVKIKRKTIHEPTFHNNYHTGIRHGVNVGNQKYQTGDYVRKEMNGQGQGGGGGSDSGEGQDDFAFNISKEEFLDYFFEDLELPNQIHTSIANSDEFDWVRAGHTNEGTPANLDLLGTMRNSIGRRLALVDIDNDEELMLLQLELEKLERVAKPTDAQYERMAVLREEIAKLDAMDDGVPFIDKVDLRYRTHTKEIRPITSAVMFCVMDVSASMGQFEKDLAKRFFTLLYLFLKRSYERIEVRFIRHHHVATEVDEQEFFHSRETGGTVVSGAMDLVHDIIKKDYNDGSHNIYVAQASDGDNFGNDNVLLDEALRTKILPNVQHMAYIEVGGHYGGRDSYITQVYKPLAAANKHLDLAIVDEPGQIWPVFKELFRKNRTDEI